MTDAHWNFEYLPITRRDSAATESDFVVATWTAAHPDALAAALRAGGHDAEVDAVLLRSPLFWYRIRTALQRPIEDIARALSVAGITARYVTPSRRRDLALGPRPDFSASKPSRAQDWRLHSEEASPVQGKELHWFLGDAGVDVDRAVCGDGRGMRLAVIDDEARDADALGLDAEVTIGVSSAPRGSSHGPTMVAWATRSRGKPERGIGPFTGVAPGATARLYVIPRAGQEVFWFPLSIVRAVDDGADVVVCATYLENTTSPVLDDALEFAARSGRGGLGAAVVLPVGREISSPPGRVHSSLTLSLADPASDPRVLCVAPSGRNGGWFFWTDKSGHRRPFANRGPSVRLAAPGDDMAYPFASDGRFGHAESSGASAIAAGVALLVLAKNPDLRVDELYGLLTSTARACATDPEGPIADSADLLPAGGDEDGHDAKCGYGRASALRACMAATDLIAASLLTIGEESAARRFLALRESVPSVAGAYSARVANWSARVIRADVTLSEQARVLGRHFRLLTGNADRQDAQVPGAAVRLLALLLRGLSSRAAPEDVAAEVRVLCDRLQEVTQSPDARARLEHTLLSIASELWGPSRGPNPAPR